MFPWTQMREAGGRRATPDLSGGDVYVDDRRSLHSLRCSSDRKFEGVLSSSGTGNITKRGPLEGNDSRFWRLQNRNIVNQHGSSTKPLKAFCASRQHHRPVDGVALQSELIGTRQAVSGAGRPGRETRQQSPENDTRQSAPAPGVPIGFVACSGLEAHWRHAPES
jgi:hypothetical protein